MAEIRIHLHDEIRAIRQRPAEAGHIGSAQPLFARPVNNRHARLGLAVAPGQFIGEGARTVRRVVIYDHQPQLG